MSHVDERDAGLDASAPDGPSDREVAGRLERLIDAARIGVMEFDATGQATFVNRRWREMTGIDREVPIPADDLLAITHPDDRDLQVERWLEMKEGRGRYSTTVRLRRPQGGWRWVDIEFDPIVEDGEVTAYAASFADVTDRVRAEEAANDNERANRTVIDTLDEGLVIHNAHGKIFTANPAAARTMGASVQEILDHPGGGLRRTWYDEDERTVSWDEFPSVHTLRTGEVVTDAILGFDYPEGGRVWLQMNTRPLPRKEEDEPLVAVSFRDITLRKNALDALRDSEGRYRALLEQAPIGHVVVSLRGEVIECNQVFADLMDRETTDIIGMTPLDIVHPDDLELAMLRLASLQANESDRTEVELRIMRKDDVAVWTSATAAVIRDPHGEPQWVHVCVHDNSEQRLAERRMLESENRYRAMVESLHDGIIIVSRHGLEAANEAAARILGVTLEQLMEHPEIYDGTQPVGLNGDEIPFDERPTVRAWVEKRPIQDFVQRITLADGHQKWLNVNTRPLLDEEDPAADPKAVIISFSDITERKEAEDRLRESEERYRHLAANSPLGQLVSGLDGVILEANRALAEIVGAEPSDLVGKGPWDFIHTDDLDGLLANVKALRQSGQDRFTYECRLRRTDGGPEIWAVTSNTLLRDSDGKAQFFLSLIQDVTERRRAEEDVRRLASVVESTSDLVGMIDYQSGRLLYLNRSAREILGYVDQDVTRVHLRRLYVDDITRLLRGAIETAIRSGDTWTGELDMRRADGTVIKVWQSISGEVDPDSQIRTIASVGRDVTERKQLEVHLAHRATHDPLTDLPNRTLLLDRLELALARAQRKRNTVALLFLDLDRFKSVNDNLGHEAGDELLVAVAERIQEVLRPTDTIARLGGDEFVVLCEDVDDEHHAVAITQRVSTSIASAAFVVAGTRLDVTASVGIAINSDPEVHPEALLRDADAAMYRAKDRGRARHELFDETMRRRSASRLELADELGVAIERGQIIVHYQPVIDLATGAVTGVEALARWQHPTRGLLPPYEFIGLAEETGLIVGLGLEVLSLAADQARRWEVELGNHAPKVHVNLSARQLTHSSLPSVVEGVLDQSLIEPERLCLEITESVLMEDAPKATAALQELKEIGVDLAIDDFGTGYSSLAYLRRFPVDVIKVDRSFVDGLGPDPHDTTIVAAIVNLAHTLGLTCVAEGVETEEQLVELRGLGCEAAQGYYFARPGSLEEVRFLLDRTFDVGGD